jgi:hypothetical protein
MLEQFVLSEISGYFSQREERHKSDKHDQADDKHSHHVSCNRSSEAFGYRSPMPNACEDFLSEMERDQDQ